MKNENSGRVIRYGSSLSQSECVKFKYYASMFSKCEPALEIGSYVGVSTICLGIEYKKHGNIVYSIDHHRGSSEHQPGGENFVKDLYDETTGKVDTFKVFRRQIEEFELNETIIPIVCDSNTVAKHWNIPISFLFIDGDHEVDQSINDVKNYGPHVVDGGILAIHDVDVLRKFKESYEGPRAAFFEAIRMGFTPIDYKSSLVFLRKGAPKLFNVSQVEIEEITGYENN